MNHPLPEAFLNNMQALLGDEYPAFLRALDAPAALALRLNPKRHGAEEAAMPYIDTPVPWCREGRYLTPQGEDRPGNAIAHFAGAFYLQEASAMASAAALGAMPGERVLDLCAAPGGKSTQIAAALDGRGLLVSNDPEPSRAQSLAGNLERMGVSNAVVTCELPGRLADRWPERFDAILVDAPCSGEGMFRRNPASRDEWNPASPEGCARRQAEILDQAARMLRPGGRLVYSTCTFNDVENERSVRDFLARHPDFAPEDFELPGVGPSHSGMLRLFPHRLRGDGHFVARLRRMGEGLPDKTSSIRPDRAEERVVVWCRDGLRRIGLVLDEIPEND
jgi:NOL1/NOP2/sun family putative RNA methylase